MKQNQAAKTATTEQQAPTAATRPTVPRLAFTAAEVAASLGYENVVTIHRLVKRGLLNPSRATRNFIFPAWELERFLRANTKVS